MNTHTDKASGNKNQAITNSLPRLQSKGIPTFQFTDNRPEAAAQSKLQELANNSQRVSQLKSLQQLANNSAQAKQAAQLQSLANAKAPSPIQQIIANRIAQLAQGPQEEKLMQGKFETVQRQQNESDIKLRENKTGLPDNLKAGIESLSGLSLDHVKVHFNSAQPAQLNALAYAQGSDIHLAPGQEQHLPHEAWHIVQQAQGRVQPTMQMQDGVPLNDDAGLEREADVMGAKALAPVAQLAGGPEEEETLLGKFAPVQRMGRGRNGALEGTQRTPAAQQRERPASERAAAPCLAATVVDNWPEAVAPSELAVTGHDSPMAKAQQATIRAVLSSPQAVAQARRLDGLFGTAQLRPDPAKDSYRPILSTIQAAFGEHDVIGIRAHTDRAATKSALAFGTGGQVALPDAPDLHTAAHEVAHVIQQRAGVALAGGVGQAGDAYRQHGKAVADAPLSQLAGPATVQRVPVPHNRPDGLIDVYVREFSAMVDLRAAAVLALSTLPEDSGGMYDRWLAVASEYLDDRTVVPAFLHAAYGYAVEKSVTDEFRSLNGLLPPGWSPRSQVTHGMTRPDFVLDDHTGERAWLDVTSANSKGHIFNKAGSGWKTKDYVFEIVYTPLDLGTILQDGSMVAGIKARRAHESLEKKKTIATKKLRTDLVDLESLYEVSKPANTRGAFSAYYDDFEFSHDTIRSLIEIAELDLATFGYQRKHANGRDRATAMQFIYDHYINDIHLYS